MVSKNIKKHIWSLKSKIYLIEIYQIVGFSCEKIQNTVQASNKVFSLSKYIFHLKINKNLRVSLLVAKDKYCHLTMLPKPRVMMKVSSGSVRGLPDTT